MRNAGTNWRKGWDGQPKRNWRSALHDASRSPGATDAPAGLGVRARQRRFPCSDEIEGLALPKRPSWGLSPLAHWNNPIKRLILGAGGDIVLGQGGQKPFQFMFTWHTQRQPFEEVAIPPEPSAASALGRERKMLAVNNFRNSPHRFVRIQLAVLIHEQAVVY